MSQNGDGKILTFNIICQEPINVDHENHAIANTTTRAGLNALAPSSSPLMFAALPMTLASGRLRSQKHFNGKIDRPRLSSRVLSPAERSALATESLSHERFTHVVGAWDFCRDVGGDAIRDTGPNELHGNTINLPSRGCKGFNWTAPASVPRAGVPPPVRRGREW